RAPYRQEAKVGNRCLLPTAMKKSCWEHQHLEEPTPMKWVIVTLCVSLSGCYFFRKKDTGAGPGDNQNPVLGNPLGPKAGGPDYARLEEIYALTTEHAPAAIRPDPDTYIRNLL